MPGYPPSGIHAEILLLGNFVPCMRIEFLAPFLLSLAHLWDFSYKHNLLILMEKYVIL